MLIHGMRWKQSWERQFVPGYYHGELYKKFQSLTQDSKSVEDYHKKMKVIMIHVNIAENIEDTMVGFLNGLHYEITNVVKLQHYAKLENMVHMTIKVDQLLKRNGSSQ